MRMRPTRSLWQSFSLHATMVAALLAAMAYIAFIGIRGEYGVIRGAAAEAEEKELEAERARLEAERVALEARVRALSDDGLELDLLEERIRNVLGMAHPDDVLLPTDPAGRAP